MRQPFYCSVFFFWFGAPEGGLGARGLVAKGGREEQQRLPGPGRPGQAAEAGL